MGWFGRNSRASNDSPGVGKTGIYALDRYGYTTNPDERDIPTRQAFDAEIDLCKDSGHWVSEHPEGKRTRWICHDCLRTWTYKPRGVIA